MKNKILIAAILLVAAAATVGFVVMNDNSEVKDDGISATINGYVYLKPDCPLIQIGGGNDCADKPYSATVEIRYSDERLWGTAHSGADGRFSITLQPGEYVLRPQVAESGPDCEEKRVTARSGETEEVDISCEGGMRPPVSSAQCRPTGCSGQICSDEDVMTTCEYREEYACYKNATCERQANGACGWTETAELKACLAGAR